MTDMQQPEKHLHDAQNLTIGFIGNPNCGKTTLFNAFTGANLKVANWPGVTVEKVEGAIRRHNMNIHLVDLPGTYSLTSYTMEEIVSRDFILSDEVDVIINVVDASALERSLYLTLQLLELGKPVVMALNMMDIVEKRGMEIDLHRLPEMLGIPVIPVSARKRRGLDVLLHAAIHHRDAKHTDPLIHDHKAVGAHRLDHKMYAMVYSDPIEDRIDQLIAELEDKYPDIINPRWHAIKLLEQDQEVLKKHPVDRPDILDQNYETRIIREKYDFIEEIIHEVLLHKEESDKLTDRLDKVLTDRFWGIPVFLLIMAVVFFLTFTVGDWLKGYMEDFIGWFGDGLEGLLTAWSVSDALKSLIIDGVLGGRGDHCHLPSQYPDPVFDPGFPGRFRVYGPGGLCNGRRDEPSGAVGEGLHPHAPGLWVHGAGCDGIPCPGTQAGPVQGDAGDAFYELQRPAHHLYPVCRDVLRRPCHGSGLFHVPDRPFGGHPGGSGAPWH